MIHSGTDAPMAVSAYYPPPLPNSAGRGKNRGALLLILALLFGLGSLTILCGVAVVKYSDRLRACPAFTSSLKLVWRSNEAKAILGEHIRAAKYINGTYRDDAQAGYALLSIPIEGSKGKGTLYVITNRIHHHAWHLTRVALWTDANHKRLDLSPPVERDAFQYPVHGPIYLVPLDSDAACFCQLHLAPL